jgi:hypothetical protein
MAPLAGSGFARQGYPLSGALIAFALRSCCIYFTRDSTSLFLWFYWQGCWKKSMEASGSRQRRDTFKQPAFLFLARHTSGRRCLMRELRGNPQARLWSARSSKQRASSMIPPSTLRCRSHCGRARRTKGRIQRIARLIP